MHTRALDSLRQAGFTPLITIARRAWIAILFVGVLYAPGVSRLAAAEPQSSALAQARSETPGAAGAREPGGQPRRRYFQTRYYFHDVSVDHLLRRLDRLGLRLPIELTGNVSADLQVDVPVNALFNGQAYRMRFTLHSNRLVVAGADLLDLSALARYENGILTLRELRFRLPRQEDRQKSGLFAGSAVVEPSPRDVRSVNDISATLDARLKQSRAMGFPLLSQMQPYLTGALSLSTT